MSRRARRRNVPADTLDDVVIRTETRPPPPPPLTMKSPLAVSGLCTVSASGSRARSLLRVADAAARFAVRRTTLRHSSICVVITMFNDRALAG